MNKRTIQILRIISGVVFLVCSVWLLSLTFKFLDLDFVFGMPPEMNVDVETFEYLLKIHDSKILGLVSTFVLSLASLFTGCSLLLSPNKRMYEKMNELEGRIADLEKNKH